MIPVLSFKGKSIAEAWEGALLLLWQHGTTIQTQYDLEPNTGTVFPPSKDAMMTMIVENSLAEPRFHVGIPGDPSYFGDYFVEVVEGGRDHWVRKTPDGEEWPYTYSGRLREWGNYLNFAWVDEAFGGDSWTHLAYRQSGPKEGTFVSHPVEPFDQISFIVDQLASSPYTRRAVAVTGFPPGDAACDDPPCLRELWLRGHFVDGIVSVDMHTKWRSRDAWKASLFNMYAMTEIHREIVGRVRARFDGTDWTLADCPRCGMNLYRKVANRGDEADNWWCDTQQQGGHDGKGGCGLSPFDFRVGAYVDTSDSFHIYGQDHENFEQKFLPITKRPPEKKYWDLSQEPYASMVEEGRARAKEQIAHKPR